MCGRRPLVQYYPKDWGLTEDEKKFVTDNFQLKQFFGDIFFIYHNSEWYQGKYPIFRVYHYDDFGYDVLENVIKEEGHQFMEDTKWYGFLKQDQSGRYTEYTEYGDDQRVNIFLEHYFRSFEEKLELYRREKNKTHKTNDNHQVNTTS